MKQNNRMRHDMKDIMVETILKYISATVDSYNYRDVAMCLTSCSLSGIDSKFLTNCGSTFN